MVNSVVTGSASGIGKAVCEQLEAQGDRVVGIDIRDAEINADLSTTEGRQKAIDETIELTGGAVDRLVLAAGLGGQVTDGPLLLSVNYFGTVDLLDGLCDAMKGRSGASAIVVSSNSSQFGSDADYDNPIVHALLDHDEAKARELIDPSDGGMGYMMSKHAIVRTIRRRATQWGSDGIRLNAIVPGMTDTPLFQGVLKNPEMAQLVDTLPSPLGRVATPEEIAKVIAFMLSDAASYIHGSVVWADGGMDAVIRPDKF